ncbi:MAG: DM13 domain-containing protein [Jaaginema sp. PMC 1079.18]|nr:DM13 domain-containing protein [Jaaginema sp. PMC 1080.18]MEC4850901.1 DM13 domain-containing protein [Jaaginema sp. PMC 1079.18]MEC4865022.1 DM13 domain-containing protein [Jaaginema sp. PMC 1078.18]
MQQKFIQVLGIASLLLLGNVSCTSAQEANTKPPETTVTSTPATAENPPAIEKDTEKADSKSMVISQGNFVQVDSEHPTQGMAKIVEVDGQKYLEFDSEFSTVNGPDVLVVFHRDRTVPVKIEEADYVTLEALQNTTGEQRYLIPDTLNPEDFASVAIWCRQFNVTFGYASL